MYRAFIIERELEKLRRERDSRRQPLALELPVPLYRPEVDSEEAGGDDIHRGVVIIDMSDYSEVDD